jgi:hypothetical protein
VTPPRLARCPAPSCPIRWRTGPDRECPEHRDTDDAVTRAAEELGIDLASTKQVWHPGDPSDGTP